MFIYKIVILVRGRGSKRVWTVRLGIQDKCLNNAQLHEHICLQDREWINYKITLLIQWSLGH